MYDHVRFIDELISLVIIKGSNGYEAVLRYRDPKDDLIIHSHNYVKLMHAIASKAGL